MAYYFKAITRTKPTDMQSEAIWIIDEDQDDRELVQQAWEELKLSNELRFLDNAADVVRQLNHETLAPFIIICSANLTGTDGFELRQMMLDHKSPKFHSVPFIFWSTQASDAQVKRAYDLSVHGFFIKDDSFEELKKTFMLIIDYWMKSKMPVISA